MTRFSANLGFLWTELALPDAIHAAHRAGFDAVECHWPYAHDPGAVRAALQETGLPMLGLNTNRGDVAAGQNGLAALPGAGAQARAAVDEALAYAHAIGCGAVHVMAGRAEGPEADAAFAETLAYACAQAGAITLLIEPLNAHDAPGYYLKNAAQAAGIISKLGFENLKLMFDAYHVARTEGDVAGTLAAHWPMIGHIQFAGVPDRGRPDEGTLDLPGLCRAVAAQGWDRPLGAEYKPGGPTEASLGWMDALRQ